MARKKIRNQDFPELLDPGEETAISCIPGSIEQKLDMCERGTLRGDTISHTHGDDPDVDESPTGEQDLKDIVDKHYFEVDQEEEDREGDDMTGDEHSSGMQGGDSELERQPHILNGLPGDRLQHIEQLEEAERQMLDTGRVENPIQRREVKKAGAR